MRRFRKYIGLFLVSLGVAMLAVQSLLHVTFVNALLLLPLALILLGVVLYVLGVRNVE